MNASSVNEMLAACGGKQAFDTPQLARKIAQKCKVPAKHFRCPHCGKYHIGYRNDFNMKKMKQLEKLR